MKNSRTLSAIILLIGCLFVGPRAQAQSGGRFDTATQAKATQDLKQFEVKFKATADRFEAFYVLSRMAPTALAAGESEKAGDYAKQLLAMAVDLRRDWNYGNAIHVGNLVLGEIALDSGDINEAKRYLLLAGDTPGSPQLDSFGPNMLLAKELLEKGERDVVLKYFEKCGQFWELQGD